MLRSTLLCLISLACLCLAGCEETTVYRPIRHNQCWRDWRGYWHCRDGDCSSSARSGTRESSEAGSLTSSATNGILTNSAKALAGFADVPASIEQANWTAPNGAGSCMWAASATVLRYFGQYPIADWWVQNHAGGATAEDAAKEAQRIGLPAALCTDGDPAFLAWADASRRPLAIHYPWMIGGKAQCHAVVFEGYRDGYAVLRDDNATGKESLVEKAHFLEVWRRPWSAAGGGEGFAWTLLAAPAVPRPW